MLAQSEKPLLWQLGEGKMAARSPMQIQGYTSPMEAQAAQKKGFVLIRSLRGRFKYLGELC